MLSPLLLLLTVDVTGAHLAATRTHTPPVIDGALDDPAWKDAAATSAFTQQSPLDGRPPSEQTTLRVLYDDDAIYFGFDCRQTSTPIVGRLTRRDRDSESDWVWVNLDSRRDGKNAVTLAVNVAGVLADGVIHDQTVYSLEWDENWEAKTARSATGWSAELRIPLRILRFDSQLPVQSWGMQAGRFIADRQENESWAYTPRDIAGGVARFGSLDDLRDLKRGGRFELRPFAVGSLDRRDAAEDTLARGYDHSWSVGMDLKWHVTQDLTLDAAANPDFAQVEADQIILNLTNIETFLPEKRPLFLEGVDAFATPLPVFYSRRIGTAPVSPTLRSDSAMTPTEELVEVPEMATIYGAGKLVGRLNDDWTVGALSALTARNEVAVQNGATGVRSMRLVEPEMVFGVLRLKRELSRNAHLGVIATGALPVVESDADYPLANPNGPTNLRLCPSGILISPGGRCFHEAYLGGIDGFWRSAAGTYVVGGQVIESLIEGGPTRQLLDGTQIGSGDHAPGGWLRIAKEGGKLVWDAEYTGSGRKLDYNDLGYLIRQNLHELKGSVGYHTFEPGRLTLETISALEIVVRRSLSGLDLGQTYELNTRWHLRRFWTVFAAADFAPAHYDDREVGDGAALQRGGWAGGKLEIDTDPRRAVAVSLSGQTQFISDGFGAGLQAGLETHILSQLEIELLPQLTYTSGEPRYATPILDVSDHPTGYLFGRLLAKSVGATLRATYTFTPRLTLQTYAQLFLASGHFSDFSNVPRTTPAPLITLGTLAADRSTAFMAPTNPDFEQAALNVNVVLRWEYRLGSTLFLVYSRSQIPTADLLPGQIGQLNLGAVSHGAAVDTLLVKLSYWWAS